jgi:ComF family protein
VLCHYCQAEITPIEGIAAPVKSIKALVSIGVHDGPLRATIHALKYEKNRQAAVILGKLLAERVIPQEWPFDIVIPVPLHVKRLKERGYNQAKLIAEALASHLETSVVADGLQKILATETQVGKSAQQRRTNVESAFSVNPAIASSLDQSSILLVDDVCTTGATLEACADALLQAGAHTVYTATASQAQYTDSSPGTATDSTFLP